LRRQEVFFSSHKGTSPRVFPGIQAQPLAGRSSNDAKKYLFINFIQATEFAGAAFTDLKVRPSSSFTG
jgi:hypothetical protein